MPEMEHSGEIRLVNENAAPVSIELTRGQRGGYGWSIKVHEPEGDLAMAKIEAIDLMLREKYLTQPEPEQS